MSLLLFTGYQIIQHRQLVGGILLHFPAISSQITVAGLSLPQCVNLYILIGGIG